MGDHFTFVVGRGAEPHPVILAAKQKLVAGEELTSDDIGHLLDLIEGSPQPSDFIRRVLEAIDPFMRKKKPRQRNQLPPLSTDYQWTAANNVIDTLLAEGDISLAMQRRLLVIYKWPKYVKHLRALLVSQDKVAKELRPRVIDLARCLSIKPEFQDALEELRVKYDIFCDRTLPITTSYMSPDDVLFRTIRPKSDGHHVMSQFDDARTAIKTRLCRSFPPLSPQVHYGLLVAMMCLGINPKDLYEEDTPIVESMIALAVQRSDISEGLFNATIRPDKLIARLLLTIAQLSAPKLPSDADIEAPLEVERLIAAANNFCQALGIDPADTQSIHAAFSDLANPGGKGFGTAPEMNIEIYRDMTQKELVHLWKAAAANRELFFDMPNQKWSKWNTFKTDVQFEEVYDEVQAYDEIPNKLQTAMRWFDERYYPGQLKRHFVDLNDLPEELRKAGKDMAYDGIDTFRAYDSLDNVRKRRKLIGFHHID